MGKEDVLQDISSLMSDIDKCENELVKAKLTDDISRLTNAYCQASRLLVQTKQELDFLYEYISCLWKDAQGDELPTIDREVIALLDNGKVVFAHRPNPEGWDAKSIIIEKTEHYYPECYDKGGWNHPNVRFWLDLDLPVEEGCKDGV